MKTGTPHSVPEGESASAGIMVSAAAEKNAASSAVSTSQVSAGVLPGSAACACGSPDVSAAAPAVAAPAPVRKPRRGMLSSAMASPCQPARPLASGHDFGDRLVGVV